MLRGGIGGGRRERINLPVRPQMPTFWPGDIFTEIPFNATVSGLGEVSLVQ
jgi:hypothetical protein